MDAPLYRRVHLSRFHPVKIYYGGASNGVECLWALWIGSLGINAWFWRDPRGGLECGLLDWGRAGQMNVASALYGSLSGGEPDIWNDHLDALLTLFAEEFAR
jgi:hypothetical protein